MPEPARQPPPTIRPAAPSDLAALTRLEASAFGADAAPAWCLRQWIDLGGALCRIALVGESGAAVGEVAEEVAGAVYAAVASDAPARVWILSVAVDPRRRGRGIADALLAAVEREARRRGIRELMATVAPGNTASRRLFARRGYSEGDLVHAYFGPGEDRIPLLLKIVS